MKIKHSGLGLAAFVVGLITTILTLALLVTAGIMEYSAPPDGIDPNSMAAIKLGLGLIALFLLDLLAIGLGAAGLLRKDRKRTLAALGILLGVLPLITVAFLIVLGLMS